MHDHDGATVAEAERPGMRRCLKNGPPQWDNEIAPVSSHSSDASARRGLSCNGQRHSDQFVRPYMGGCRSRVRYTLCTLNKYVSSNELRAHSFKQNASLAK